jgi:hypothetical protein
MESNPAGRTRNIKGLQRVSATLLSLISIWPHYSPTFFVNLREHQGKNLTVEGGNFWLLWCACILAFDQIYIFI